MVETSLHPRPTFFTFLQSDGNTGGDGLSFYDYKRAIRSNKVAILQQRRAMTYEPGYKKPVLSAPPVSSLSRKIFQLDKVPSYHAQFTLPAKMEVKDTQPYPVEPPNEKLNKSASVDSLKNADDSNADGIEPSQSQCSITTIPTSISKEGIMDRAMGKSHTDRPPQKANAKPARLVKSATSRDYLPDLTSKLSDRPSTVSSTRDEDVQTTQSQLADGLPLHIKRERSNSEGSYAIPKSDTDYEREQYKAYQWGTTTHRAFNDVGWNDRTRPSVPTPPTTTIEQFPDPVSQRLTYRRYNTEPAGWQTYGNEWDYVQTRHHDDNYLKGPQAINFCSSNRRTQQIPGYTGIIHDHYPYEDLTKNIVPTLLVRTVQPWKTVISRRGNIPGYTGQVHWSRFLPSHSNMPTPEPTTSARIHRRISLEDELSPFQRDGILSKMVTTVSPYNPFNKIPH